MRSLSGAARLAGIAGWPVAHSRSPRLHGFWLDRHGIDGAYVPLAVPPERFETTIRALAGVGFAGLNVTVPHKVAAFALCDVVEPSATRAGAVNTLVFEAGRITGSNTDGFGFMENLREHSVEVGRPALLLGAGGAARAIAASLVEAGARVTVTNRTRERAERLAADLPGVDVLDWDERSAALAGHGLLVNTTTLGMAGAPPLSVDLDRAPPGMAVADIVYVPALTPLLAAARERGLPAVGGLGMLLHQARPGFAAWFGVWPVVDEALAAHVAEGLGET